MEVNGEFVITIATTIVAVAALLWRFETRISGVETRLGERIARVEGRLDSFATKADVARIEGLLEGYIMQVGKKEAQ